MIACIASFVDKTLPKDLFLKEIILILEFEQLQELTSSEKVGEGNKNVRVASPRNVYIHLKVCNNTTVNKCWVYTVYMIFLRTSTIAFFPISNFAL